MDDFDMPETPEELDEMKRLREGLERFPFGGQMRSGEQPTPINPKED